MSQSMRVLVVGESGQLAQSLKKTLPENTTVCFLGRNKIDLKQQLDVTEKVTAFQPDIVINASAYTAVDRAESDREEAFAINATGVKYLALAAKQVAARFVHVSTDFVFDGKSEQAYKPDDRTNPVSVYGESKLAGEQYIKEIYSESSTIIRTSWVYSEYGNNFVKTMLKLMAEKEQLSVVDDQVGCPTYATGLAAFIWRLCELSEWQFVYHWSDSGKISWYEFAKAIQEEAIQMGLLTKQIPINAIPSVDYPTPATRPQFSLLECSGSSKEWAQVEWRKALNVMLSKK